MRVIYRKIRHARYLYIKRNVEKVWGARYTLGARYLSNNTVFFFFNERQNGHLTHSRHQRNDPVNNRQLLVPRRVASRGMPLTSSAKTCWFHTIPITIKLLAHVYT